MNRNKVDAASLMNEEIPYFRVQSAFNRTKYYSSASKTRNRSNPGVLLTIVAMRNRTFQFNYIYKCLLMN